MSQSEGRGRIGDVSFLSTHPANAKRIKVSATWVIRQADDVEAIGQVDARGARFWMPVGMTDVGRRHFRSERLARVEHQQHHHSLAGSWTPWAHNIRVWGRASGDDQVVWITCNGSCLD